jgi:sugar phosphate isomerase/epimerase
MSRVAPCVLAVTVAWSAAAAAQGLSNPFFAFDNGTGRDQKVPFEAQAKMLKDLGYAGIGFTGTQRIPEMLAALDANGLKMFNTYVGACVNPGRPPYDPGLKMAIHQLKGRDTVIWLYVTGGKPSSSAADDRAVAIVREIADMAAESGLRVALYPHTGLYVARVEDAVRLVKKVDRKNVGATFNLCHFLKTDNEKNLETRLKEVMPYLFVVSINGADGGATNDMLWDRLIQTLDRGSFDVGRVLKTLKQLHYTGPIGLQCYAVRGDVRENLQRSIDAWHKLSNAAGEPAFGYDDTPRLPNSPWRVHDRRRPQPAMVTPGDQPGMPPADAVVLFDGKDLSQWEGANPRGLDHGCIDILKAGQITSKRHFGDCQLHVEWATPAKDDGGPMNWGNSGIYFLGLYELQIIESHDSRIYADGIAAAIYGQTPPMVNAARKPGQWQTFDVAFTAPRFDGDKLLAPAYFTVFWNGVLVQNHTPALGPTLHRELANYEKTRTTSGPILLQKHGSAVRFRNIWVRPLKPAL